MRFLVLTNILTNLIFFLGALFCSEEVETRVRKEHEEKIDYLSIFLKRRNDYTC